MFLTATIFQKQKKPRAPLDTDEEDEEIGTKNETFSAENKTHFLFSFWVCRKTVTFEKERKKGRKKNAFFLECAKWERIPFFKNEIFFFFNSSYPSLKECVCMLRERRREKTLQRMGTKRKNQIDGRKKRKEREWKRTSLSLCIV